MHIALRGLALNAVFVTLLAAPAARAETLFDLDGADARQRLAIEHPAQYDTVLRILGDAEKLPQTQLEGYLRTTYEANDVSFGPLLMVSLPPKRRLGFRLGDTSYAATVTVVLPHAIATPAR